MKSTTSGVFVAFLLVFLLLLAAPVLFFLYGYGFLQLPELNYLNATVAATAGLFIIPVFLVFLAAIIMLAAKRKGAAVAAGLKPRQEPEHYPWEGVFRAAVKEEFKVARASVKTAFTTPKPNVTVLAVAAVIAAATVVFFVMVVPTAKDVFTTGGKGSNLTATVAVAEKNLTGEGRTILQVFKAKLSDLLKTNQTNLAEASKSAEAAKKEAAAKQKQEREARQKEQRASSFSALATKFRAAALKASAFWPYAIAGIGVLVLLAGGFYVYKAKKIRPAIAIELLRTSAADSADWFAVLFTAARRSSIKIVALAVVVAAAVAAFVFRGWLLGKVSKVPDSAVGVLLAVRDFFSAYRIYIAIGITALLVILGILFVLERKGKEIETASVKTKASKK